MAEITLGAQAKLPTAFGEFIIYVYQHEDFIEPILVLKKEWERGALPLVRIHSACATGDIFSSLRCDCQAQLQQAEQFIANRGGLLIYAPQEGRGIGIINKIKAYALQDEGMDTIAANVKLGFAPDLRQFNFAVDVLNAFQIHELILLTNNPQKYEHLKNAGFKIHRQALWTAENRYNQDYLRIKKEQMGHLK